VLQMGLLLLLLLRSGGGSRGESGSGSAIGLWDGLLEGPAGAALDGLLALVDVCAGRIGRRRSVLRDGEVGVVRHE
jgi:hypothetical protein